MTFKWHEFTFIPSLWAVLPRGMSRPLHLYSGGIQLLQERYPPSDDWHHPIQRLEPGKKKIKAAVFFPQKCQDVLYRISKNMEMPWMIPPWFPRFRPWGLTSTWLWFPVASRWNPQNSDPALRDFVPQFPSISLLIPGFRWQSSAWQLWGAPRDEQNDYSK